MFFHTLKGRPCRSALLSLIMVMCAIPSFTYADEGKTPKENTVTATPTTETPVTPPAVDASTQTASIDERMALAQEIGSFIIQRWDGIWKPTAMFQRYDEKIVAFEFCDSIPRFGLESTSNAVSPGTTCPEGTGSVDIEHNTVQAIAENSGTPLTLSMVQMPYLNFIIAVTHEWSHAQSPSWPTLAINETVANMMSMLVTREFVRAKHGETTNAASLTTLIRKDVEAAPIIMVFRERFASLYDKHDAGKITDAETEEGKAALYTLLHLEKYHCDPCAEVKGNGDFARILPYYIHFELFHELHQRCGNDVRETSRILFGLARSGVDEEKYLGTVRQIIAGAPESCVAFPETPPRTTKDPS